MNNNPLVSIIMPAYNAEKYIAEAIESIIAQTYTNWELLIADDGSTDNTKNIIKDYANKESRIKTYHNSENIGYLKTCNKLFKICKGELITFQDADDISVPKRIEKQYLFLKHNSEIVAVGCQASYFKKNIENIIKNKTVNCNHVDIYNTLFYANQFSGASVMFRRKLFDSIGCYKEFFDRIGNEDYDFFFRIAKIHKVANLDETLYYVRLAPNSISRNIKSPRQIISADLVKFLAHQREKFGKDSLTGLEYNLLENYENKLLADFNKDKTLLYRKSADSLSYSGLKKQALYSSFKALKIEPFKTINIKYFLASLKKVLFITDK